MPARVHIVPTGAANLASVAAAVRRAGREPVLVESAREASRADRLLLPGVGTYGAAMAALRAGGLVDPLRERLREGRPTLAICVGLQLLGSSSDESPDERGLGLLPLHVHRFPESVRVPQFGWNQVRPEGDWLDANDAYFANSYCLTEAPDGDWKVAWSEHGVRFVSALQRGRILACQFHPELSGRFGQGLIERWLGQEP